MKVKMLDRPHSKLPVVLVNDKEIYETKNVQVLLNGIRIICYAADTEEGWIERAPWHDWSRWEGMKRGEGMPTAEEIQRIERIENLSGLTIVLLGSPLFYDS